MSKPTDLTKEEIIQALAEMQDELENVKEDVDSFNDELGDLSPGEFSFDELEDDGDKEKAKGIKTPADAKKALSEAKKDIQDVLDNFDALIGQTEEEQTTATFKRSNEKYASSILALASSAEKAIADAKNALSHWSFLPKMKKQTSSATGPSDTNLKKAFETIKQAKTVVKETEKLFKESTAVPPTGAKFTGDKWAEGKNTVEVESRHWHGGADKFKRDKKWEDARPNPAVDERLTTVEYSRDDSPHVNATMHKIEGENKYASYWDVVDSKEKKRMLVTFAALPDEIGPKDDKTLQMFASRRYGSTILNHIIANGFDSVKEELSGRVTKLDPSILTKTAATDKATIRKYYKDAYGDSSYAMQMGEGSDKSKMDIDYKPKDDTIKEYDENTKDGTGKISSTHKESKVASEDKVLIQAKANRAVELATLAASRGVIEFNAQELKKMAKEYMSYSDDQFKVIEKTFQRLPITNGEVLKTAHIPDAESGIIGNPKEGVRNPKATVKTENVDTNVSSDAKIAKQASFIPQVNADNQLNRKSPFKSRIVDGLQRKGVISEVKKANYKTS